ncbi:hypothetical protein [Fibrella aquatica]|uniref:hypothetical protein n=1 Tax=Fibrella aquatica TaxID=3242487 RepID=UPI003520E7DC
MPTEYKTGSATGYAVGGVQKGGSDGLLRTAAAARRVPLRRPGYGTPILAGCPFFLPTLRYYAPTGATRPSERPIP